MPPKNPEHNLIHQYGKALRRGTFKDIVDFNDALNINFSFQIHLVSDLMAEFNGEMPPNRISHYVMVFIKNGSGEKTIGGYRFKIQPGMVMIYPKNVIHSGHNWSLETTGYMISFSESLFEEMQFPVTYLQLPQLFKLSIKPYHVLEPMLSKKVEQLYIELSELKASKEETDKKIFMLRLSEIILLYKKALVTNAGSSKEKETLFDQFAELVETNFRNHREVGHYARLLSVHPNHLNKVVNTHAAISAKAYILNRVFSEGKYLLSATKIPSKEIAYDLGFNDYNYFCRQFKQVVGTTPLQYRSKKI